MQRLITLFFLLLCSIFLFGQEGVDFRDISLKKAKRLAKKENKIIFVDAYTRWCAPCKWMNNEVFPNIQIGEFFNEKFISLQIDLERGQGKKIKEKYKINYYPTYLFLDTNAEVLHKVYGAKEIDEFLESAKIALEPNKRLAYFENAPISSWDNPKFLYDYAYMLRKSGDPKKGEAAMLYLQSQKDWDTKKNTQLIFDFVSVDLDSDLVQYLIRNRKKFASHIDEKDLRKKINNIILLNAPPDISFDRVPSYLSSIIPKPSDPLFKEVEMKLILQCADLEDHGKEFMFAVQSYMASHNTFDDWETPNNIAWYLQEFNLGDSALILAKDITYHSINQKATYHNYDTMASICYKLKLIEEARSFAQMALDKAVIEKVNATSMVILLDKIEKEN